MASESGFSNQLKKGSAQYKTIHSLGSNKFGQSVASKALFEKIPSASIVSVVDVDGIQGQVEFQIIEITAHGAIVGDILRIDAGDAQNYEFDILEIIDVDHFKILALLDSRVISGVLASIMGWVTNKANANGSQIVALSPTALAFNLDGVLTDVNEDTATPANSIGLPISQLNADGTLFDPQIFTDIELDCNAILTGIGAPADAAASTDTGTFNIIQFIKRGMQNWTSLLAKLPALVGGKIPVDASGVTLTVNVGLTDTELRASAVPVSLASIPLATGAATEAKQDTGNTSLGSIDTKLTSQATAANQTSTNTKLDTLIAKDFSTSAKQDVEAVLIGAVIETAPATDTASSGLNGRLQRIAQRITSLIALLPASLGQKVMASSLAVTIASDQSALATSSTIQTTAGTVSSVQATVGISAVRATVAGTAPSATRKKLLIKPSANNSGKIYLGASGVTTANGLEIVGPDRLEFEYDSGDYYLISDTAAQVVEILEKV